VLLIKHINAAKLRCMRQSIPPSGLHKNTEIFQRSVHIWRFHSDSSNKLQMLNAGICDFNPKTQIIFKTLLACVVLFDRLILFGRTDFNFQIFLIYIFGRKLTSFIFLG
jgi:hypothetical protein